jgi:hypothetical protein
LIIFLISDRPWEREVGRSGWIQGWLLTTMDDDIVLFAVLSNDHTPFPVPAPPSISVGEWKIKAWEAAPDKPDVRPAKLIAWMVRTRVHALQHLSFLTIQQLKTPIPAEDIVAKVASWGPQIPNDDVTEMNPGLKLSRYFPQPPEDEHIHIIVQGA